MSERVADERAEAQMLAEKHSLSPQVSLAGQSLRFDGPQSLSVPTDSPTEFSTPNAVTPQIPLREKSRQLAEVGQFMLQIQAHLEEIQHREEIHAQQQADLGEAQRQFEYSQQAALAEIAARQQVVQSREESLQLSEQALQQQITEWNLAHERLALERQQLAHERAALQQEMQQELVKSRQLLEAEHAAVRLEKSKVEELSETLLQQHRQAQSLHEQQLQQEREQLWTSLSQEWDEHRAKFEAEKAAFFKDRALLENRLKFQQDHLEKMRLELEQDQQSALHEQQIQKQQLEEEQQLSLKRKQQLDQYRVALEELDRAIERERELNSRLKSALTHSVDQERQEQVQAYQRWEEERRLQQAELQRQQELLLAHTENLEARRQRLEALRGEVEATNHSTMELRLAVEDVWAQLQQSLGVAAAQAQVIQAKQALRHDYEHWEARLQEQRRELEVAEQHFEQQRLAFQEERQTLSQWMATRDQELQAREQQLHLKMSEFVSQDQDWQQLREQWLKEKATAEQVIRQLLNDLVDKTSDLAAD